MTPLGVTDGVGPAQQLGEHDREQPVLDTPEKVEAYCNQVGMDLANYALGMRRNTKLSIERTAGPSAPTGAPTGACSSISPTSEPCRSAIALAQGYSLFEPSLYSGV